MWPPTTLWRFQHGSPTAMRFAAGRGGVLVRGRRARGRDVTVQPLSAWCLPCPTPCSSSGGNPTWPNLTHGFDFEHNIVYLGTGSTVAGDSDYRWGCAAGRSWVYGAGAFVAHGVGGWVAGGGQGHLL
jgi:hypothetical protein